MKDPRPITDKSFQNACQRALIKYLTTHNYGFDISPKILSSPTGKDFHNIITFLAKKYDSTFVIAKPEDDVPNFFKMLKYPFPISKKGLSSVAAPHTSPSHLAALTWIVELYNVRFIFCHCNLTRTVQ